MPGRGWWWLPGLAWLLAGCSAPWTRGGGGGAEEGLASYYSASLAGRRTASGERYDPAASTCAHRTHRFGTRLRVTRVDNGVSVTCRVNDRGPFKDGRVVDVSGSLARRLGLLQSGVAPVRLSVVASR